VQRIIELWCGFTGETLGEETGLIMQSRIFDRPLEAGDVKQLGEMEQNEQISRKSYLEQIIKGGVLTVVTSAEEEIERLEMEEEEKEEIEAADLRNSPALTGEEPEEELEGLAAVEEQVEE
jgi:RimJ/RimL family protein N-acetyltransferase